MSLDLNYFHGNEAEQFSFYRIPKVLLTDERYKCVSMEAKVLYGLMLDRMGLSVRSGWLDGEGRVYIYFTMEDAMAVLNCGKDKAVRLFKELDTPHGVGLIERRKQGQGKPARIYVKNFTLPPNSEDHAPDPPPEPLSSEKSKSVLPAPTPSTDLTSEIPQSAHPENRSPDSGKTDPNKTDKNKTEMSDTELSSYPPPVPRRRSRSMGWNGVEQMDSCRSLLRANISYGDLLRERPYDADLIDGYVELMVEACCSGRETIRVNQEDIPASLVRSRFMKLNKEHILYVMESLQRITTRVGNIRAYTLSVLYNSPVTIGHYYAAQVGCDMAQGFSGRPSA